MWKIENWIYLDAVLLFQQIYGYTHSAPEPTENTENYTVHTS